MNKLSKSMLMGLLEQESQIVALYGGGFKPPTKGHFEVAKQTLEQYPEIDKLYIVIGNGLRDNISPDEAKSTWEIYKNYLSDKVEIVNADSPLTYIKQYSKDNPNATTYAVLGTRENSEEDSIDYNKRKEFYEKYGNNIKLINITLNSDISGTKAREAAKISQDEFNKYLPDELNEDELDIIYDYVKSVIKENKPPKPTSPKHNYNDFIKSLTEYMLNKGMNIKPLPKVKFINNDVENASDFFGKTAYYDPNERLVVLYTNSRHPKDVMRSFCHEMIHHLQNCENRLTNISTDNTNEDGDLPEIEREAYEKGNMVFRNWEDSVKNLEK
jgi:phosphopantetheine adenylyltransferase